MDFTGYCIKCLASLAHHYALQGIYFTEDSTHQVHVARKETDDSIGHNFGEFHEKVSIIPNDG